MIRIAPTARGQVACGVDANGLKVIPAAATPRISVEPAVCGLARKYETHSPVVAGVVGANLQVKETAGLTSTQRQHWAPASQAVTVHFGIKWIKVARAGG